jgi:hypothetical protein
MVTAETIAKALGGRKAGGTWMARCPAHDDREPSLPIADAKDGKVLVRCHAGCDQERVIAALRALGLWGENPRGSILHAARRAHAEGKSDPDTFRRTQSALAIWQSATPAQGKPVKIYLTADLPIPDAHRYRVHPAFADLVANLAGLESFMPDQIAARLAIRFLSVRPRELHLQGEIEPTGARRKNGPGTAKPITPVGGDF